VFAGAKKIMRKLDAVAMHQYQFSLLLSVYVGVVLNLDPFFSLLGSGVGTGRSSRGTMVIMTACCLVAFTYVLLWLSALGGLKIYRLLASIIVLFSAAAAYYMTIFKVVIGYGIMISVLTTDLDLNSESVGYAFFLWLIPTALLPIFLIWRVNLRRHLHESMRSFSLFGWSVLSLCLALLLVVLPLRHLQASELVSSPLRDSPDAAGEVAHRFLPTNWIASLGMVAYNQYAEHRMGAFLFDPGKAFSYKADPAMDDVTVVFVIGESARYDHLGLYGYGRDTSPLLAKEKNLVALKGRSCDTSTKLSLRCMFVREGGAGEDEARTVKEKNIFSVLRGMGFHSDLYSMQSELWFYNSVNANNYLFREMIAAERGNEGLPIDDRLLLPELKRSLADATPGRHLIVLHTKGSHFLYSQRYPRAFARYQPECFSINAKCGKAELINAYDNSLLYTDTILKQVLDQLRQRKALLIYASDHGESIDDKMHFHGTPRSIAPPEQRQVPIMVWMSDRFLATPGRKAILANLKQMAAAGEVKRHEEIFDSMLGCLGYTSPNGGIKQANNWCRLGQSQSASVR